MTPNIIEHEHSTEAASQNCRAGEEPQKVPRLGPELRAADAEHSASSKTKTEGQQVGEEIHKGASGDGH